MRRSQNLQECGIGKHIGMIPRIEKTCKLAFLYFSRLLGLFYLSRYVTRRALRILCYHGFSLADEHLFRPSLFITPETFARRLEFLQKHLFPVISLETAVARLATGDLTQLRHGDHYR